MPSAARVLVAPDSFKGTLTAAQVAEALSAGLTDAGWAVDLAPVADGGEGTAAVLADALGGSWVPCTVTGPVGGSGGSAGSLDTGYFITDDGAALLDAAGAGGLAAVPAPDPATAWAASSIGAGELIAAAVAHGARQIVLGVGGSASTDGGRGAVEALTAAGGLGAARLRVLCDVRTAWADAPAVFGPQKGADTATVQRLARRLDDYADRLPRDPRGRPLTGAAGGLAGGLWAAFGAELVPGAGEVLRAVRLRHRARHAVAVITGEGRFDHQSLLGKVVSAVLAESAAPVHLMVGSSSLTVTQAREAGFASLTIAGDPDALRRAARTWRP